MQVNSAGVKYKFKIDAENRETVSRVPHTGQGKLRQHTFHYIRKFILRVYEYKWFECPMFGVSANFGHEPFCKHAWYMCVFKCLKFNNYANINAEDWSFQFVNNYTNNHEQHYRADL